MTADRRDMTYREVFEACNGNYPTFSALIEELVAIWNTNAPYLPLFPGTQRLIEMGRERGWIYSDSTRVVVHTPPAGAK